MTNKNEMKLMNEAREFKSRLMNLLYCGKVFPEDQAAFKEVINKIDREIILYQAVSGGGLYDLNRISFEQIKSGFMMKYQNKYWFASL